MPNIVPFPTQQHRSAADLPYYSPSEGGSRYTRPMMRQGDHVVERGIHTKGRVGIVRNVFMCPIFNIPSSVLVEFQNTKEWIKPNALRVSRVTLN